MFYIQFEVCIHNPEEYGFIYTKTSDSDDFFKKGEYEKISKEMFEMDDNITILDEDSIKDSNGFKIYYWDFLNHKKQKFYRLYTFILNHEEEEGKSVFEFEFTNSCPFSQMRMFNREETIEDFLNQKEKYGKDSRLEYAEQFVSTPEEEVELEEKTAKKVIYTQFKMTQFDSIIRNYTFIL